MYKNITFIPKKIKQIFILLIILLSLSPYKSQDSKKILDLNENDIENKINFNKFLKDSILNLENIKNPNKKETEKFNRDTKDLTLKKILKDNGPDLSKFSIPMAKYFLKIASFSYCDQDRIIKQTCCSDIFSNDEWKLFDEKTVKYDDYQYAILISEKFNKILITFPGTKNLSQLIKELYYSNGVTFIDDETEKTMEYLKYVYSIFGKELEETLEKLFIKFNNYQFIFTGHSLGGNMATISALHSVKYGKLNKSIEPVLITYGQARTGNDVFANEIMKYITRVYRVTRRGDIVTTIPPCSWTQENWGIKCSTILPEGKFDKNLVLNVNQKNESKKYFYTWHIAGWYSFNDAMEVYKYCGEFISENNNDSDCQLHGDYSDISFTKHRQYFGISVGDYCQAQG